MTTFTHWHIINLRYLQKYRGLDNYRFRRETDRKNLKTHNLPILVNKKNIEKSVLFSITGKKADRIEEGFSPNNRPKRAENKSNWHQARSYHRFQDIRLHFMSVRLIARNCFPCMFSSYTNFRFSTIKK